MSGKAYMIVGDAREIPVPDGFFHCAVTSPPYWGLRDYGHAGQLGLEGTPEEYVANIVEVCREVWRVLRKDGTFWLNIGDCYAGSGRGGYAGGKSTLQGSAEGQDQSRIARGSQAKAGLHEPACEGGAIGRAWVPAPRGLKQKNLVGMPWRVALALQADGWILRSDIIWHKTNAMPSPVSDRPSTGHEYLFLFSKRGSYFYDADAIREPITSTGGACFGKQKVDATGTGAQSRKLADPSERNNPLGRNKRTVWSIPTKGFPGAHFATFPPRLIEPCIKAGTSERGCCESCGAPWKRVVEKVRETDPTAGQNAMRGAGHFREGAGPANRDGRVFERVVSVETTGWQPTCKCPPSEPVPCRVLDMFGGAGTTPMVAARLGRVGYGIERKHEYAVLARDRLTHDAANPMRLKVKRPKRPKPVQVAQSELFPDAA